MAARLIELSYFRGLSPPELCYAVKLEKGRLSLWGSRPFLICRAQSLFEGSGSTESLNLFEPRAIIWAPWDPVFSILCLLLSDGLSGHYLFLIEGRQSCAEARSTRFPVEFFV